MHIFFSVGNLPYWKVILGIFQNLGTCLFILLSVISSLMIHDSLLSLWAFKMLFVVYGFGSDFPLPPSPPAKIFPSPLCMQDAALVKPWLSHASAAISDVFVLLYLYGLWTLSPCEVGWVSGFITRTSKAMKCFGSWSANGTPGTCLEPSECQEISCCFCSPPGAFFHEVISCPISDRNVAWAWPWQRVNWLSWMRNESVTGACWRRREHVQSR